MAIDIAMVFKCVWF